MLKLTAGLFDPSYGEITKSPIGLRIAFLRQEFADSLNYTRTLKQEIIAAFEEDSKILLKIDNIQSFLESSTKYGEEMQAALDELQILQEKAILIGAYNLESRANKILDMMGFAADDHDQLVSTFSGGWKMRIGLAKIFCSDP